MSHYQTFIFKNYEFNRDGKTLKLHYSYDNQLNFTETYRFNFDFVDYDPASLDRAIQLLFFVAGTSYYKAFVAPSITIESGEIDQPLAEFLSQTYQRGLGEFFYVNQLDPQTAITFPANSDNLAVTPARTQPGQLVGLGGGKDSLVSVELLRDQPRIATWSLNHQSQLAPLVECVGLPHFWVEREWDAQLKTLGAQGALNGHIPISAIFASVGTIVSILTGYQQAVVSNESSASEPTLNYRDIDINHQYSKSFDFEESFQACQAQLFGESLQYYSLLRPFTELRIAELFSKLGFATYQDVFSSCNRAYTHDQNHMFWCGECAKCAFVFLILTPFISRPELEALWGGKNLLLDEAHQITYKQLLGIEGDKPLDCVGEVKESRAAMRLAQQIYPELAIYKFDIPDDYDFRAHSPELMPAEILEIVQTKTAQL